MKSVKAKAQLSMVLGELKKEYLEKFPRKLEALQNLTDQQNWQKLEEEYHKLKGTGKTYGFPEVSTVCQRLEDLAQNPATRDPETFQKALTLLEKIYQSYVANEPLRLDQDPFARSFLALEVK